MGRLRIAALLTAFAAVVAGCADSQVTEAARAPQGAPDPVAIAEIDGARLRIPAGSASEHTDASATLSDQPPSDGMKQLRASSLPKPVDFEVAGVLEGPVEVSIPLRAGIHDAVLVYRARPGGAWVPVDTQVADGRATATVTHLSTWDAIKVGTSEFFSGVGYTIQDWLGNRAEEPECPRPLPDWVEAVNVIAERNAALLACGQTANDGSTLHVTLAANRGYAIAVSVPNGVSLPTTSTARIPQALAAASYRMFERDKIYIPAASQVTVAIQRPGQLHSAIELQGSLDWGSWIIDAAYVFLDEAAGLLGLTPPDVGKLYDCVVTNIETAALGPDDGPSVYSQHLFDVSRDCIQQIALSVGVDIELLRELLVWLDAADIVSAPAEAHFTDTISDGRVVQVLSNPDHYASATRHRGILHERGVGSFQFGTSADVVLAWLDSVFPSGKVTGYDESSGCGSSEELLEWTHPSLEGWLAFVRHPGDEDFSLNGWGISGQSASQWRLASGPGVGVSFEELTAAVDGEWHKEHRGEESWIWRARTETEDGLGVYLEARPPPKVAEVYSHPERPDGGDTVASMYAGEGSSGQLPC